MTRHQLYSVPTAQFEARIYSAEPHGPPCVTPTASRPHTSAPPRTPHPVSRPSRHFAPESRAPSVAPSSHFIDEAFSSDARLRREEGGARLYSSSMAASFVPRASHFLCGELPPFVQQLDGAHALDVSVACETSLEGALWCLLDRASAAAFVATNIAPIFLLGSGIVPQASL